MTLISALLVLHWIGDFRLQTYWMALNKSNWNKSWEGMRAILSHVATYTLTLGVGLAPLWLLGWIPTLNGWSWLGFLLVTFGTHLATDAVTSKGTAKNWFVKARSGMRVLDPINAPHIQGFQSWIEIDRAKRDRFFNIVGFDQMIHFLCLFWAAHFIGAL